MRQVTTTFSIRTHGRGLVDVTEQIRSWVDTSGIETGLLTVFIRHTSASLLIQENADSAVLDDLERFFARLVRDGDPLFTHVTEGKDDMPAHVRAALTQTHLAIPVVKASPTLGTWQGIYLFEHRTHGQVRQITLHLIGE